MKLRRFSAKGIHGYLNFDVKFNERLTFLTGINGSGKTTVLSAVTALLSPDLAALQALDFGEIRLEFEDDDKKKRFIGAKKIDDKVSLSTSSVDSEFGYIKYIPDPTLPLYRQSESETEHYRELVTNSQEHPGEKEAIYYRWGL